MQNTHKDLQDSGLHNTAFFTTKYISQDKLGMDIDNIEWNRELHREYSSTLMLLKINSEE